MIARGIDFASVSAIFLSDLHLFRPCAIFRFSFDPSHY